MSPFETLNENRPTHLVIEDGRNMILTVQNESRETRRSVAGMFEQPASCVHSGVTWSPPVVAPVVAPGGLLRATEWAL